MYGASEISSTFRRAGFVNLSSANLFTLLAFTEGRTSEIFKYLGKFMFSIFLNKDTSWDSFQGELLELKYRICL